VVRGRLGELLKQRQKVEVTGLELHPMAATIARQALDQVLERNVERPALEFESEGFDCIVCADVLEHLREPGIVFARIRRWLTPEGLLVISLPSIRLHSVCSSLFGATLGPQRRPAPRIFYAVQPVLASTAIGFRFALTLTMPIQEKLHIPCSSQEDFDVTLSCS